MNRALLASNVAAGMGGGPGAAGNIRILYLEDNPHDFELVRDSFEHESAGFRITRAQSKAEFENLLEIEDFDLVLTDFNILGYLGLNALDEVQVRKPGVPVVIVTGTGSEEVAVESMKRGAADYVLKTPIHIRKLPETVKAILGRKQLEVDLLLAQEQVKINENRFRSLVEATLVVPWEFDELESRFTYIAPQIASIFGYPRDAWFTPGFYVARIHQDDRQRVLAYTREQTQLMRNHIVEYRLLAADERCVWVRDMVSLDIADGRVVKQRGVLVDISASKTAEQELRRFAEIVATTTDLMSLRDEQERFLVVNEQYCRYFNMQSEQIIGRTAAELFSPEQYAKVIRPCSERSLRGESVHTESWLDYPGAGLRYMDFHYHPFRDAAGRIAGTVVSARDITERKQAEQDLQARLEQQAALARFSSFALIERDPDALARQAVELCAQVLDVEYCKVLEVIPRTGTLLLRAGVGWRDGLVGHAVVEAGEESQAGYTLLTRSPVIVTDLRTDSRFHGSALLSGHDIVSGISVIIGDPENPFGVLGAHTGCNRKFTLDDAAFLEAVANTLAGAMIRSRTELSLAAAEQRFSLLLNSSPSVIYATSVNGNFRCNFVSNTVEEVVGYAPEVMMTDPAFWMHQIHPDDMTPVIKQVLQGIEQGAGTLEYRFRHRDGAWRWLRDTFRVLRDTSGKPSEVVGTWTDVTERVRMETELRSSEERFRLTAQTSSDLIFEWHIDTGEIRWVGDTPSTFDYRTADLPQSISEWLDRMHPDDVQRTTEAVRNCLTDPARSFAQEYRIRIGDRGWRIWESRGSVVQTADAQARRWIGSCTDVTDARQMKERLIQSQKMDALGQLTGGVAHDFNNRLTVILGNLELLERRLADRDAKRLVQSALAAAEGGAELTRQLLAFSRKQVLESTVFDVNTLLHESHDLLARTLGETITVSTVCSTRECTINSDRSQLENIILNLAVNAKHAMPNGGKLTIETAHVTHDAAYVANHANTRAGNFVMIAVSDSGTGMSEEVKRHAFEPFFTTKPQGLGTGLGLAMVFGFVTQSGGHVELYSEEGHGTCVKLYLPRHQAAIQADAVSTVAPQESAELLRGYTVLLVEDEAQVREVAVEILGSLECELLVASNAAEALKLFEKHPAIDLLFTDVVMPGTMGGAELAVALRERRPGLKVLYTSGYAPHAVNGRYQINGPNDHWIAKPYRAMALCNVVRETLLSGN